jgi:Phytanoyl-CoA dioxygenase (PhyH)
LGAKHGFREIVMRSPGRYEIAIRRRQGGGRDDDDDDDKTRAATTTDEIYSVVQQYLPFVPDLLRPAASSTAAAAEADEPLFWTWDDVILQGLSIIISTTGAVEQAWHADGGHVSVSDHLNCHCLNIFIPLQDLSTTLGPTELRPHSHYYTRGHQQLGRQLLLAKARKTLRPVVAPLLRKSDCLIFDYRLLHRGLAHTCTNISQRLLLNLTISLPWFRDVVNFPRRSLYDDNNNNDDDHHHHHHRHHHHRNNDDTTSRSNQQQQQQQTTNVDS